MGADVLENQEQTAAPELPTPGDIVDGADNPLTDIAAERQLIGYLLTKGDAIESVLKEVGEGDFFDPFNRQVFAKFAKAHEEGWAIDLQAIVEALGGKTGQEIYPGFTASQYVARLIVQTDMKLDPGEVAAWIQSLSEKRAIGSADDREFEANAPFVSKMGLKMWADQNERAAEYDYLVEDLIPENEGCLVIGDTGTGKSFLMDHLALCGARGVPFFGRRILKPFGTIWFAYEAARGQTARMRAYAKFHNVEETDLPFAVLTRPVPLWPDPKAMEYTLAEINGIVRTRFDGIPLGLCVFDTYNAATPGASEIDSEVVSKIRKGFDFLRAETGASTLIVGHTNSAGKHRGNEQLTNNIDTVILIKRKTFMVGREVFPKKDDDGIAIRTMRVQKQREGIDGEETDFILRVVEDGTVNKFGRPRTSCVVDRPNAADSNTQDEARDVKRDVGDGFRASKNEILFMECLLEMLDERGVSPPPPELQLPRSIPRVVDYASVKRLMASRMLREEDDTEDGHKRHRDRVKQALGRARVGLMHWKIVAGHSDRDLIWWTGKSVRGVKATQPKRRDLFGDDAPSVGGVEDFY